MFWTNIVPIILVLDKYRTYLPCSGQILYLSFLFWTNIVPIILLLETILHWSNTILIQKVLNSPAITCDVSEILGSQGLEIFCKLKDFLTNDFLNFCAENRMLISFRLQVYKSGDVTHTHFMCRLTVSHVSVKFMRQSRWNIKSTSTQNNSLRHVL
jgi:hypothetical protein